jgi:hypothetical protein
MRLSAIFVPLGVALAVAGGIMYYASLQPAQAAKPYILGEVRHPVSAEMTQWAKSMSKQTAPFFKVKDIHGIDVQIGGEGKKPQFVYFILDGCPCSLDVQPLFNKMYLRFKDKVEFIGVINVGKEKGLDYAGTTTTLHPVVSDEALKIVKAYGAKQSTYSALIAPDGTILRMWPGYSQGTLHELNRLLAKAVGTKEEKFDAAYAPNEETSGCKFQ